MFKISEETQFVGRRIIYLPKCRSTNDMASDMAGSETLEDGTIIVTDHQSAGKGQFGNSWEAKPAVNLIFSIYIRPGFIHPMDNFHINLISSLSVQEALRELETAKFTIKWPNDIMFEDRKLCGILIENKLAVSKIIHSIIGIGLNINQTDFNPDFNATSLINIFNREFDRNRILNRIVYHFDRLYMKLKEGNVNSIRKQYIRRLYRLNTLHSFVLNSSGEKFKGIIKGIDEAGMLKVLIRGQESKFKFKEITYLI